MNKKLMIITTLVLVMVMAAGGVALAGNGNGEGIEDLAKTPVENGSGNRFGTSEDRGSGQMFSQMSGDYETEEELHAAVLEMKLGIIADKVEEGILTQEEADAMVAYLTSCDGDCETEGENPDRPVDGWGIFGSGTGDGTRALDGNGNRGGNGGQTGERTAECEDGEPALDGHGTSAETGNSYRGGNDKSN